MSPWPEPSKRRRIVFSPNAYRQMRARGIAGRQVAAVLRQPDWFEASPRHPERLVAERRGPDGETIRVIYVEEQDEEIVALVVTAMRVAQPGAPS